MVNNLLNFALLFETAVAALISYVEVLQTVFGTRALACAHFGIPAMAYFVIIFFYDETRKIYVRAGIDKSVKGKIKYTGWIARNTHW